MIKKSIYLLLIILVSCDDEIFIPEAGPIPSGSFIYQVDTRNPFKVTFAASSPNAANYYWDFGNEQGAQGPSAVAEYSTSGNYTVTLTLINTAGVTSLKQVVSVSGPETPVAGFTMAVNDQNSPLTVAFTNTTEFGETFTWDFGDGQTSTARNPVHTYAAGGRYSIRLTATGSDGIKTNSRRREIFLFDPSFLAGAVSKSWKFSAEPGAYQVRNPEGEVVISSSLLPCELNDVYTFSRTGEYTNDNAGDARLRSLNYACGALDAPGLQPWSAVRQTDLSFNLVLTNSYIGDPASGPSYSIVRVNANELILRFDRNAAGGTKETVEMSFVPL